MIAAVSVAVYANSFHNSFHFDDQHFIVENQYIRDISNIPSFFGSARLSSFEKIFASHYRPLLVTSYALNYAIDGLKPAGYHIVNLIFHIGSAFMVYMILEMMLRGSAGLYGRLTDVIARPAKPVEAIRLRGFHPEGAKRDTMCQIASSASGLLAMTERKTSGLLAMTTGRAYGPFTKSEWTALVASLIFTVHPFNSEVVNYITARSSVMCTFLYLLSFYCWVMYRQLAVSSKQLAGNSEQMSGKRFKGFTAHCSLLTAYYLVSLLAFILAMLTKEIAITLPVMLIMYDIYFIRSKNKYKILKRVQDDIKNYMPFILLVVIPYLIYRFKVFGGIGLSGSGSRDLFSNLIIQTGVLLKYMQLMIFPRGLTIEHDFVMTLNILDIRFILPASILLAFWAAAYILVKRGGEWRVFSFFIVWFFVTLLPTTVIPLNAILQENRGYIAGIAFPLLAAIIIGRFRRSAAIAIILVLISVLSIMTVQRNTVWKDDLSLWSDAAEKSPGSARVQDNVGLAYLNRGDYDNAILAFRKTLELNPQYYLAYYNAGVAYHMQKKLDMARTAYEKCLEINPRYFRAHYNLGIIHRKKGELDEAIFAYERAISIDPRHAFVFNNLGVVLTEKGEMQRAEDVFKRAVAIDPGFEKAYFNLGNLYFRTGRYELAADEYRASLRIRPDYREAREMLNETLNRM